MGRCKHRRCRRLRFLLDWIFACVICLNLKITLEIFNLLNFV